MTLDDTPTMRRRASDLPWPERLGRGVAKFFSAVSSKEGLGAAFGLVLLFTFIYFMRQDRADSKEERAAIREERRENSERQTKAMETIGRAMEKQADVLGEQRAQLEAIRELLRTQVRENLEAKAEAEPPPKSIPVPPQPAAQPLPKTRRR